MNGAPKLNKRTPNKNNKAMMMARKKASELS